MADRSNHCLVYCKLNVSKDLPVVKTFSGCNLKSVDRVRFQVDLESMPWHQIYETDDTDGKVDF